MAKVSPLEQFTNATGLSLQSIVIVAGLSFIVGAMESSMLPFESPVYIAAAALTYAASVHWGLFDGIFVATGVVALLFLGSIFRTEASLFSFMSELPADLVLFAALGVLPGLAVELFAGSTRELDGERAMARRRIAELNTKLQLLGKEKRAQADNSKSDDGRWNRRGNQLGDAGRRMVAAESVTEVLEILGGALNDALQPAGFFLAVADGTGGLTVSRVEPAPDIEPGPVPADDATLREVVRAGKPMTFAAASAIGQDGLSANVLVPVLVNKQIIALVGMEMPDATAKEELDYITVVAHFAQEVSARFGLPA